MLVRVDMKAKPLILAGFLCSLSPGPSWSTLDHQTEPPDLHAGEFSLLHVDIIFHGQLA